MTLKYNPYIAGNPVGKTKAFVGREDIIHSVLQMLHHPEENALVLYGQRRIGKTSVLQYLYSQLPLQNSRHYCPISFDLQDKANLPLDRVVEELAFNIAEELKLDPPNLGNKPAETFKKSWLPNLLKNLSIENSVVLMFDEFDVLAQPQGEQAGKLFFPYLRELIEFDREKLNFIFVLGRNITDLTTITLALFKNIKEQRISLLKRTDTEHLIRLSERNNTLIWPQETIENIWERASGHAYFTQTICSNVWEKVYEDYDLDDDVSDPKSLPKATLNDIEEVISDVLTSSRNALEWLWDGLPSAGRVVASALASAEEDFITEEQLETLLRESGVRVIIWELQDAPQRLQDWDLLEPVQGGYKFKVQLLKRWIREQKPLERVQQELDRTEPVADALFKAAQGLYDPKNHDDKKLEEAITYLRKAIALNPNHIAANKLLAEILITEEQLDEARELLEHLYAYQPSVARSRLVQVLLKIAENCEDNEAKQLDLYTQILGLDATQPEAQGGYQQIWKQRGERHLQKYEFENAISAYHQAGLSDDIKKAENQRHQYKFKKNLEKLKEHETNKNYSEALKMAKELAIEFVNVDHPWNSEITRLEKEVQLDKLYKSALFEVENNHKEDATRILLKILNENLFYEDTAFLLSHLVSDIDGKKLQQENVKLENEYNKLLNDKKLLQDNLDVTSKELKKIYNDKNRLEQQKKDLELELDLFKETKDQQSQQLKSCKREKIIPYILFFITFILFVDQLLSRPVTTFLYTAISSLLEGLLS